MGKKFELHVGALAKPLSEQLSNQGFTLENTAYYESLIEARTRLFFSECITESECKKVTDRLFKLIARKVKEIKDGE